MMELRLFGEERGRLEIAPTEKQGDSKLRAYCRKGAIVVYCRRKSGGAAMNDYLRSMRSRIGHDTLMLVGATVVLADASQILLQKRRDDGNWALHGGCMEIGETPEQAARRELLEETGLTAGRLEPLGVFTGPEFFHTYPNGDKIYLVAIAFLCSEFSGSPLAQTDETTDLRRFDWDKLPPNFGRLDAIIAQAAREKLRKV